MSRAARKRAWPVLRGPRRGNAPGLPDEIVEIVFSIVQKKALTPNDFPGLGTLSYALLAFVNRYNRTARPFNWKFTADNLTALLRRTSQHEQAPASQRSNQAQAA